MPSVLPQYVVLKSKYNNKYLEYVKDEGPVHGYLRYSGDDVTSPLSKFQVQMEDGQPDVVHLLNCYSNRYLAATSLAIRWIVAKAEEPETDRSKWSCTFFEPTRLTEDGDDYRFRQVYTGNLAVCMNLPGLPQHNCLLPGWGTPQSAQDVITVIDWGSLVVLPQFVSFKGDNDHYLRGEVISKQNHMSFSTPDSANQTAGHEVFRNLDGTIRLKSTHFGKFWRASPNWILAESDDTSTNDRATLFWPIKIDHNTIALRSLGNDLFAKRFTDRGLPSCLQAASPTIDVHARLQVTELVIGRNIYNVEFHLDRARRYNERVATMGIGGAANSTDHEGTLNVSVERSETRSTSWSSSVSLTLGVKTEFVTRIPFLAEGKIEVSTEVTASQEWGGTEEITNTIQAVYTALVPPMTKVTVSAIGTTATCDVPFSYTQTDTYVDGRTRTYRMDDGLYTGINSFNVSYQIHSEDLE